MLTLELKGEDWDDETERFVYPVTQVLEFEHSLVSLSKWESIHEKPFLGPKPPTPEELFDYVYCMLLTPDVPKEVLQGLTAEDYEAIDKHINRPMTGTTFPPTPQGKRNTEIISADLVYYWMDTCNIPQECETWHLNRLFTRIRVHDTKSQKPKKQNTRDAAAERRALVEARRKQYGSNG